MKKSIIQIIPVAAVLFGAGCESTHDKGPYLAQSIEVQANCVFKDVNGMTTGDETPFQAVILTENATEQVKFVSMNDKAKRYTIRVRQAR